MGVLAQSRFARGRTSACALALALVVWACALVAPSSASADYVELYPTSDRSTGTWFFGIWDFYDDWCVDTNVDMWDIVNVDPYDMGFYDNGMDCNNAGQQGYGPPSAITAGTLGSAVAFELEDPGAEVSQAWLDVVAFISDGTTGVMTFQLYKANGTLIGTFTESLDSDPWMTYSSGWSTSLTAAEADGMYVRVVADSTDGELRLAAVKVTVETQYWEPPAAVNDGAGADVDGQAGATSFTANWSAIPHTNLASYEYCVTTSSTGADCAAGALRTWTNSATTTATATGLSMSLGARIYACVRGVGNDTSRTTMRCSDGAVIDSVLPSVPTLISPADGSSVTVTTLSVQYADLHTDGYADFQVCPVSDCSSTQATGTSTLTAMNAAANWGPSLPAGTWYWRARARDSANNTTAWSSAWSFTLNNRPSSTQSSPASNAWVATAQPTLVSTYSDPDGHAGRVRFQLCQTNPVGDWSSPAVCPAGYQTVLSPSGPSGSSKSAAPTVPLGDGTWYWRSWGIDAGGAAGTVSAGRALRVDTTTPTDIDNVVIVRSGLGKVSVSWDASTDTGSGSVRYDVEWSADGVTYTSVCNDTFALTCTKAGLGGTQLPFFRIRACDLAGNCTLWDGRLGGSANGYFLRTSVTSGVLTDAANRRATLANGTADTLTKQQYDVGETGWMQVYPGAASTANPVASEPAGVPAPATGRGWTIDETAGSTLASGSWAVTVTSDTPTSSGTARLQCRAWIATIVGSSITASSNYQSAYTDATDIYAFGQRTHTCVLPGLASQTSLAANQYVYVELYVHSTVATTVNAQLSIWAEGTGSAISIPPPGVAPNAPTLVSPADGALLASTPTLQVGYSHPASTQGAIQYEVATDAAFTDVVRNATSALLASGASSSTVLEPLPAGATYYWRARARDSTDLVSAWSTSRSFTVTTPPATPTNQSPANGSSTFDDTPLLDASAFADIDAGDSHGGSQFQVTEDGTSFATGLDSGALGATETWTTPVLAAGTWAWRVRYRDSFGSWSGWSTPTTVTVQASTLTLAVDTNSIDLGTLATGADDFGSVTATITTTNASGYDLLVAGTAAGATATTCGGCAIPLQDWMGSELAPTTWDSTGDGYLGVTVRDATAGRMAKWGTGTGTAEGDIVANRFAGIPTTPILLHERVSATAGDTVLTTIRAAAAATTSATSHSETLTFSAVANP